MLMGWIYLLPSNTISVMVKYAPKWAISAVIPAEERKILVHSHDCRNDVSVKKEFGIQTPKLILTHSLKKPWEDTSKVTPYFSLFAFDPSKKDGIYVMPYRISNVYPSGTVCFGDTKEPSNLRQANNYFWSSPFNKDNCPYTRFHREMCKLSEHEYYDHYWVENYCECGYDEDGNEIDYEGCECDPCRCECCTGICNCACECDFNDGFHSWITNYSNYVKNSEHIKKTSFFCGRKYFAYPKPTKAIFLSNNKELLNSIPKTSWRRDSQKNDVVIGIAKENDRTWDIDLGSHQFSLETNTVETI